MHGSFEAVKSTESSRGMVMRQMAVGEPIGFHSTDGPPLFKSCSHKTFAFGNKKKRIQFLTYQAVLLDLSFWQDEYRSPALNIDQKWPYMCLILGFGLMTVRLFQVYYRWFKFGEPILKPRDDEELPHA